MNLKKLNESIENFAGVKNITPIVDPVTADAIETSANLKKDIDKRLSDAKKASGISDKEFKDGFTSSHGKKTTSKNLNSMKLGESYSASSYYGKNYSGLEDSIESNDISKVEEWIWEKCQNGGYVELKDSDGNVKRYKPAEFGEEYYGIEDLEESCVTSKELDEYYEDYEYEEEPMYAYSIMFDGNEIHTDEGFISEEEAYEEADQYIMDLLDEPEWEENEWTDFDVDVFECEGSLCESLNKIVRHLTEKQMSDEDRRDTELIKSILAKTEKRANAKLTPEEQEVMSKYNLDRYNSGNRNYPASYVTNNHRTVATTNGMRGDMDKMNLADRARKYNSGEREYTHQISGQTGNHNSRKWYGDDYEKPNYAHQQDDYNNRVSKRKYQSMKDDIYFRNMYKDNVDTMDARRQAEIDAINRRYDSDSEWAKSRLNDFNKSIDDKLAPYRNRKNKANELLIRESYDEKVVIYKEGGKYRATPESNYNNRIQNDRKVTKLDDFNSPEEIIDYYKKYGWANSDDEFIIKESCNIIPNKRKNNLKEESSQDLTSLAKESRRILQNKNNRKSNLKESSEELARKAFASLVKETKPYTHYLILIDGNYEDRISADNDDDAIAQFYAWCDERNKKRMSEAVSYDEVLDELDSLTESINENKASDAKKRAMAKNKNKKKL